MKLWFWRQWAPGDERQRPWEETMNVSPAFAPTYSLERVVRKQGREGGPSSPVKSLSGREVTERSGRPRQLEFRQQRRALRGKKAVETCDEGPPPPPSPPHLPQELSWSAQISAQMWETSQGRENYPKGWAGNQCCPHPPTPKEYHSWITYSDGPEKLWRKISPSVNTSLLLPNKS